MRWHGWSVWVLSVLVLATAYGQELVENGSFDSGAEGWRNRLADAAGVQSEWLPAAGRGGSGCAHIRATTDSERRCWIWRHVVEDMPAHKALRVSGWIKGRQVAKHAAICVQGWDAERVQIVDFATTQTADPPTGDFDWTRVETDFTPSSATKTVHILVFISGNGEIWFDDISAVPIDPDDAREAGGQARAAPGLFVARGPIG